MSQSRAMVARGCISLLLLGLFSSGLALYGADSETEHPLSGLGLRNIGPAYPSGRIADFAFYSPSKYLVATASGGLWLTQNQGTTWQPLFDEQASYSLGVVEIAPQDPQVIWVGTGENNAQRSVAYGDGVYKSTDGGRTWQNMGLTESGHIAQIWINPADSTHVRVAAQGPLWSSGGDRGLYETRDDGQSWQKLLEIDADTGVNEFVVSPQNIDHLVASSYQRRRHVWTLINGGPGSGIHRSTDGGKTWNEVSQGLPKDHMGRIGLAGAPSAPNMVYAIIEANAEEKGVYRSTDFGQSFSKRSDHSTTSPQYYNELVVDPKNANRIYSLDTFTSVSEDGGATFTPLATDHRHVDDHALWINPADTDHVLIGGDGGIYESWDRGQTFRHFDNLPITQFYRVTPDNAEPFYNVCGGTQDNNSLCAPSRTTVSHGITNADWKIILGGDGYKAQSDPTDPDIIYTQYQYGGLARYDRRTQERLYITPKPKSGEADYKWNWNTPLLISPHDHQRLYYAAEYVFRSDDRGNSWRIVSPDLTRGLDRNALPVMGRIWSVDAIAKNDSTSIYGSIIGFHESPIQPDLLYAGTDDGVISVSSNAGANWRSVRSVRGVPEMSLVEDIIASEHDANVAYAVFDNHKRGDYKPYVYKSTNQGRSWRSITGNLPRRGTAHTIAEDHVDPNLLFVGTEFGLFFTQDGGGTWHELTSLPTIAVRDIEIQRRENDLVVGTFGRGVYILDDYTPLRTPQKAIDGEAATLFEVKDAWLYVVGDLWGGSGGAQAFNGDNFFVAENPEFGALFRYHLSEPYKSTRATRRKAELESQKRGESTPYPPWDTLRLEDREIAPELLATVKDSAGRVVRILSGATDAGLHQIAWDLRLEKPDPVSLAGDDSSLFGGTPVGPLALPGEYSVQLSLRRNGRIEVLGAAQSFQVKSLALSPEITVDREALQAFQLETSALVKAVAGAVAASAEIRNRIAHLRSALNRTPAATQDQNAQLHGLKARLDEIDQALLGDRSLQSRNEPAPLSISARVNSIRGSSWHSQSTVASVHRDSLSIANQEFTVAVGALSAIEVDLKRLENRLDELGAPWTPGRLPRDISN